MIRFGAFSGVLFVAASAMAQAPTAATPPAAPGQPAESASAAAPAPAAETPPPVAEPAPAAETPPPVAEPVAETPAATPPSVAESDTLPAPPNETLLVQEQTPNPLPIVLGVMWDLSQPVGSTSDFVGSFSGRGFALDFRYWGFGRFGVGAAFVWDTMSHKSMVERTIGDVTVSGVSAKELDSNVLVGKVLVSAFDWKTVHAEGHESKMPRVVIPYAAFGFGGARIVRRTDIGVSRYVDESWHWALSPEIGVEVPTQFVDWMLAVRFNYIAGSSGGPEQLFMNFGIGGGF